MNNLFQNRVAELSLKKKYLESEVKRIEEEIDKSTSKVMVSYNHNQLIRFRSQLNSVETALELSMEFLLVTNEDHQYQLES